MTNSCPPSTCLAALAAPGTDVGDLLVAAGATTDALVEAFPVVRGGDRKVTSADPEGSFQAWRSTAST